MIKYDGKGRRTLSAREIAFREPMNRAVAVGTRIVGKTGNQFVCQ